MDYTKLIKDLRFCVNAETCENCDRDEACSDSLDCINDMLRASSDAIENLLNIVHGYSKQVEDLRDQRNDLQAKYDALHAFAFGEDAKRNDEIRAKLGSVQRERDAYKGALKSLTALLD